jgi:predicted LPLAT superfamily acyltransferase
VISSYSFHEDLYAAAFYPVKMMYWMFGGSVVKASRPYLEEIEHVFKPSFVALVSMMSA